MGLVPVVKGHYLTIPSSILVEPAFISVGAHFQVTLDLRVSIIRVVWAFC